jgi:hypothetical protein
MCMGSRGLDSGSYEVIMSQTVYFIKLQLPIETFFGMV